MRHPLRRWSLRSKLLVPVVALALASPVASGCGDDTSGDTGSGAAASTSSSSSTSTSTSTSMSTSMSTSTSTSTASSVGGSGGATQSSSGAGGAGGGTGGAGGNPKDCSSLPLCDDFEGAAVDGPPDPTKWDIVQPDCGGGPAVVVIDDTVSHSGQKSVRVEGGIDYCDHKFFADQSVIGTLGPDVYGRFYIRFADALGDNHVTFLSMKDQSSGGPNLRMGGQGKVLMYNRESDDAVLPSSFSQSVEPAPLTWYCIEFRINGAQGEIQTWIDGVEAPGLRVDGVPTNNVDDYWLQDTNWHPSLQDYRLGWESYSNQAMTVWFDDVALADAPIGCD